MSEADYSEDPQNLPKQAEEGQAKGSLSPLSSFSKAPAPSPLGLLSSIGLLGLLLPSVSSVLSRLSVVLTAFSAPSAPSPPSAASTPHPGPRQLRS